MAEAAPVHAEPRQAQPNAVVHVKDLVVEYGHGIKAHRAVDQVSFAVAAGATLAVVGESGAGKSTIGKVLTGLVDASSGWVEICGEDRTHASRRSSDRRRRAAQLQVVPQDPFTSVDPRQRISSVLEESLTVHDRARGRAGRAAVRERVVELISQVGLNERHLALTSRQLSGGQLQRVAIARALAVEPPVIVLDEAVSALDVSVQAQVLNLLRSLQERSGVAFVFITHDLSVVRQVADEVLVLRSGKVVEAGPVDRVLEAPQADYTKLLLASTPQPGWKPVRRDQFLHPSA